MPVQRRLLLVVVAAALATGECTAPVPSPTPPAQTPSLVAASPVPSPPLSPTPRQTPDLTARPLVWFAPLPPYVPHMGYGGSEDYFDLFGPGAPWSKAAGRVGIFKIYASWVQNYATPEQLQQVVRGVADRGLALGLEIGAFAAGAECGAGVEGFDASLDTIRRIHAVGGRVDVVAFDEPLAGAVFYDGRNACHWSTERAADEAARFVRQLRTIVPGVMVGDIEPAWSSISADDLARWLDAYQQAAGEPFGFLHLDADWGRADWADVFLATEQAARARGVAFAPMYNGGDASTDKAWADLAMQRAYTYETVHGGRPDHVVLQSWMDHPDRVLPESDPTTFTGLIDRYLGTRTLIRLDQVATSEDGRLSLEGALLGSEGSPVAGAPITISATPLDGAYQVLRVDGRVPSDARGVIIGIRVNTEGTGLGDVDLRIYRVSYADGGEDSNRVTNPKFSRRLEDWVVYGDGRVSTPPSDRGSGRMLRLVASTEQTISINHQGFAPTPGSEYHLRVSARVPETAAGTAYLAAIFLVDTEIARDRLPLEPAPIAIDRLATDATGVFRYEREAFDPGTYRIRIEYAGDAERWPAFVEREVLVR